MMLAARLVVPTLNERPQFIAFDPVHADADHKPVMQLGAATANLKGELADSLAVDAGHPCRSADAKPLSESGNDSDLLVAERRFMGPIHEFGIGRASKSRYMSRTGHSSGGQSLGL
jgi:hypothetical protein